jgi:hypothetical protein
MKTFTPFFLSVLKSLQFVRQVIRYALIFVSPSSGNEPHWDVNWLPFEVSSPSSKNVLGRRNNPVLDLTRHFVSCRCCCQGVERMEVCTRPDETQDGSSVAKGHLPAQSSASFLGDGFIQCVHASIGKFS